MSFGADSMDFCENLMNFVLIIFHPYRGNFEFSLHSRLEVDEIYRNFTENSLNLLSFGVENLREDRKNREKCDFRAIFFNRKIGFSREI